MGILKGHKHSDSSILFAFVFVFIIGESRFFVLKITLGRLLPSVPL